MLTPSHACVWVTDAGEALTGARAGQVLSRESKIDFGGPTASCVRKATWNRSLFARTISPPRGPRPCARTEVTYTGAGRSRLWPWGCSKVRAVNPEGVRQRCTVAGSRTG